MSLYNQLFGTNKFSHVLLRMIDISPLDVPRFRDCYLNETGDEIIIFTRTGGGNRQEYEAQNEALRRLPNYISDEDDTLDVTYAKFHYSVPDQYKAATQKIKAEGGVDDPTAKFKALLDKIENQNTPKDDPDVKRALDIFDQIDKSKGGIIEI